MKEFIDELYEYSLKYLTKDEAKDLISFYEEIISERLATGDSLEVILKDYNKKEIIKEALPEVILKRDKKSFKTFYHVMLIMFSTPILIPLAILYFTFILVALIMVLVGAIVIISGVLFIIPYIIEVFSYTTNVGNVLGLVSIGVFVATSLSLFGYYFGKVSYKFATLLGDLGLKLTVKRKKIWKKLEMFYFL